MSQTHLAKLRCRETGEVYYTRINRKRRLARGAKGASTKLVRRKYSPRLRRHALFEETKK